MNGRHFLGGLVGDVGQSYVQIQPKSTLLLVAFFPVLYLAVPAAVEHGLTLLASFEAEQCLVVGGGGGGRICLVVKDTRGAAVGTRRYHGPGMQW